MTLRRPICSTEWGWAMASSTLWVICCMIDAHLTTSFSPFFHFNIVPFYTFLRFFLCLTGCYVSLSPFQYSNANKICSNLDAYVNSMSYANSRLMLTITDFSLSHAVWARYQIHDDFYFYSMTFSEVCHRYWAQTRARMGYLQICDENS